MFLVVFLAGAMGWVMPFYYSFFNEYSFKFPSVMEVSIFGSQIRRDPAFRGASKLPVKKTWMVEGQYFLICNSRRVRVDFTARFHGSFGMESIVEALPDDLQKQLISVVRFHHSLRSSGVLFYNVLHGNQLTDRLTAILFRRAFGLEDCIVRLDLASGEYFP